MCSFDFSGCGLSEGEYISLGWHEKDDVDLVVKYLEKNKKITKIVLWGRSMGSSAAILYTSIFKEKIIAGLVFDSPFCSLKQLSEDIAKKNSKAPKCIMRLIWMFLKKKIMKKNNFNINDISPITYIKNIKSPAFFISAKNDRIIDPAQMNKIYEEFSGKKIIQYVEGDHNSQRPDSCLMKCAGFIHSIFTKDDFDENNLLIFDNANGDFSGPPKKNPIFMIPQKKIENDEKNDFFEEEKTKI